MSGAPSTSRPLGRAARTLTALSVALGVSAVSPRAARASGLDAPWITSGTSGPTTPDASAIYWNPAELAFLQRTELMLGAGLIIGHVTYERERRGTYQTPDTLQFKTPLDPANVDKTKSGKAEEASATPISPTGNLFLAIPAIPNRLTLGVGVYVPYAAALSFPDEGAQKWQLRQAFIVSNDVTASAGVQVTPKLSIGAGISYVGGIAELSKVQDFAGLNEFKGGLESKNIGQANDFGQDAPTEVRELDILARSISIKSALSHGISFNVGVAFNPSDKVRFALSYQHGAAMNYKGEFAIDMNDSFFTQDLSEQGLKYKPIVKGDATLSFSLPKRLTAGFSVDASKRIAIDGLVSYILYSDVDAFLVETSSPDLAQPKLGIGDKVKVTLPRDWNDTVWVEAGAKIRLNDRMLATASLGFQTAASPDSTIDVASPDGFRLIGDVGGVIKASDSVFLSGDVRVQGIVPRTVEDSRYDLGNGTYGLVIATVGGHLKFLF